MLGRMILMLNVTPPPVGIVDGRLRPCPGSPNCVCSQDTDTGHSIAPLKLSDDAASSWKRLQQVIAGRPRARIVSVDERYLHVEMTSAFFRFVDDVEFLLDPAAGVIHVRSASRLGYSDLGVNRKRIEGIRASFESR